MNWRLLSIEPTKDKKAITRAYRSRLPEFNPEDHPEEFKALRAAYEEALRLADTPDEEAAPPEEDTTPVGRWMSTVKALYADFPARIDPAAWRNLLSEDVCLALDTRPDAERTLIEFLLEHFFLPQEVWQELDRVFAFSERRAELIEHWPANFIDFAVLGGIRNQPTLPYKLFLPGQNAEACDEYRHLYNEANQTEPAKIGPILDKIEALSEYHPYGEALRMRYLWETGDKEAAEEGYRKLAEAWPDEVTLVMGRVSLLMLRKDWEEAERLLRHILELMPEHIRAARYLADTMAGRGRYEEAKEIIYRLIDNSGGDQKFIGEMNELLSSWNAEYIQICEKQAAEHPEDKENLSELAWSYLQEERGEEAQHVCESFTENDLPPYDYHNLFGKLSYMREDYDKAVLHLTKLAEIIRTLEPDGSEKTARRLRKLPEVCLILASCFKQLGRTEEALSATEEALRLAPDNPGTVNNAGRFCFYLRRYEQAAGLFRHFTELEPDAYHGHLLLASTLFELGQDREAFSEVSRAIDLDGSDLGCYILKMRILLRNGVFEGVHQVLDFLHQNGITDEINTCFCEAQLNDFEAKNKEKALEQYQTLAARLEGGEEAGNWEAELYFRIVVLLAEDRDVRIPEHRQELLALLEKGLKADPDDYDCLEYKAWLLKRDDRRPAAREIYLKLEQRPRHPIAIERELAELYYDNLNAYADKACDYYTKLIDYEDNGDLHFFRGTCHRFLGELEAAEADFLREQEMVPDDIDGYRGLSLVYRAQGRTEEALLQAQRVLEMAREKGRDKPDHYHQVLISLRRLGRVKEALALCEEMEKRFGKGTGKRKQFDVLCQFGLEKELGKFMRSWKWNPVDPQLYREYAVREALHRGDARSAAVKLSSAFGKLPDDVIRELARDIAAMRDDRNTLYKEWLYRADRKTDYSQALLHLADLYLRDGDRATAVHKADQALAELDRILEGFCGNEKALYVTRRAWALALLGRSEEAYAELEKARSLPLCDSCCYSRCKDADIFEAQIAEICGEYKKALALCEAGLIHWPDETDFICIRNRILRKVNERK